ncbi:MAG TPA: type VI secretion system baseplate subunit TssF [Nannocystis exedens]|nr:type VI secretion system baseplate subunit TssF [Nannocystis exedens]
MNSFDRDYARELAYLREGSRSYATSHPHNAGHLARSSEDADVERLLEGFAFISAGIRAQIDGAAGSFARRMLASLGPHWVRPTPPATVVELRPDLRVLRSLQRMPRGKELLAAPIRGVSARFTTAADVDLLPIELVGLEIAHGRRGQATMCLRFRSSDAGAPMVPEIDHLRLFIHHRDPTVAATLRMWLTRYCVGICAEGGESGVRGAGVSVRQPFADPAARLQPWPEAMPMAIQALVEGLAYPEFSGFVDLLGIRSLSLSGPEFGLLFSFEATAPAPSLPELPHELPADTVLLHCAPALNLFQATGEPFEHLPGDRSHLIRVDGVDPGSAEVYEITELTIDGCSASARLCGVLPADGRTPTYAVDRSSALGERSEVRVSIEGGGTSSADPAIVSTRILCTNGDLAHNLGVGMLGHGPRHLLLAACTNITPVTPPIRPVLGADRSWRLLDHLGQRTRTLDSPAALRDLLALHAPPSSGRGEGGLLGKRSLRAICGLERRRSHQLVDGVPTPVVETTVKLDRRELSCVAEAELLGELLDRVIADFAGFDAASVLSIGLFPGGERLDWPLRRPDETPNP